MKSAFFSATLSLSKNSAGLLIPFLKSSGMAVLSDSPRGLLPADGYTGGGRLFFDLWVAPGTGGVEAVNWEC